MTPARTPSRAPGAAKPAPGPRRMAGVLAVAGVIVVAVAIGTLVRGRGSAPAPAPAPAAPVADSLATMPADSAYATALRLVTEHRSTEALAYFRRARRGLQDDFAAFHYNYGAALYNGLFVADTVAGLTRPAQGSSDARVGVMRESLQEVLRAIDLAQTPRERAFYANRLGHMLQTWGFAWEAFTWYGSATNADPGNLTYRQRAAGFQAIMADPLVRPGEQSPDPASLDR